ncbi:hypothetical protein FJZ31_25350 [Candidatus Poribacteria bacterium]|nr:hypothetical protein [Candidatus Poribacteria bacterium]
MDIDISVDKLGFRLKGISPGQKQFFAQLQPEPFWQIEFRDSSRSPENAIIVDNIEAESVDCPSFNPLTYHWHNIDLGDEKSALDIIVRYNSEKFPEWRIQINNRSQKYGIWRVNFPRVSLTASEAGELAVPMGWGTLYKNPTQMGSLRSKLLSEANRYRGDYPNGWCTMQFAALCEGREGLYLATHDGKAYHKEFSFQPISSLEKGGRGVVLDESRFLFEVIHYPEEMGVIGKNFELPYPVVIKPFDGTWVDAAKIYRDWAQEHSIWFARQPLEKSASTPQWLKEIALWCQTGGDPKDVVPNVLRFADYFQVPIAVHWYSWHQIPFDDHYPEYFPAKEGFKEAVEELHRAGIYVMPYINGRLFDSTTDSWKNEGAERFCALNEKDGKYVEVYGSKVPLSPMCPSTSYWQDKVAEIVERLVCEFKVDGVYIDQIGAAGAKLCFNPEHPHPLGNGDFWVSGYRQMLQQVRQKMKACNPESMLTTEDAAEPYSGLLDAYLMCNQTRGNLIPMYPAVYGGRNLTFGRYIFPDDAKASLPFITKIAQMFIFGAQMGWLDAWVLDYPKEAEYLKTLSQARLESLKYLVYGELVHSPVIDGDLPLIKTQWHLWGTDYPIEMPAVIGSAWKAADGSIGLVFTNMSEETQRFRWKLEKYSLEGEEVIDGRSAMTCCNHTPP